VNANAFALAGPPASGKSTLLRVIPSVIRSSIAIDLELFGPAPGLAQQVRREVLDSILATTRHGILFFGVADVPFAEFAHNGVEVIGLYTTDRVRYLQRLRDRNRAGGRPETEQSEHFRGCMGALDLLRRSNQLRLEIDIFDPRLEGRPVATAEFIANGLSLPTYDPAQRCDAQR
jgi:hypothetical protein